MALVVHIERDGANNAVGAWPQRDPGRAVNGKRHDEAVIVIGMFADEVDATRRADDEGGRFAKFGGEVFADRIC